MTTGRINQVTPCLGCPWDGCTEAIRPPQSPLSFKRTAQCKRIPNWGLRVASDTLHCRFLQPANLRIIATLWHSNHTSVGGEQHPSLTHQHHSSSTSLGFHHSEQFTINFSPEFPGRIDTTSLQQ